ncbi:MAG: redox-regulated ATPase YchF [Myxococcales bacterium]|nr:redox-regulated ATPase YchF [Myxococcales bacterium]
MKAGIVGLPNVGKSTLFNALTAAGAESANYPFCTIEPNVGIVSVPDPRLAEIQSHIATQKVIPAVVEIVDIAGLVRGASQGEGLGNQFLGHIRNVDAVLHVVRCFEDADVVHVDGSVDPIRDIDTIDTELIFADLESVERQIERTNKKARGGDKEAIAKMAVLEPVKAMLSEGKAARAGDYNEDDLKLLKSAGLITIKPVLYVCNVDEDSALDGNQYTAIVAEHAKAQGAGCVVISGQIEAEVSELDDEERDEFLADLGLTEPGLDKLARAAYNLLGLQTYFTAGEKEIRAWTIPVGATAPQAAGVIHTDFERGFIRAQVYSLADLNTHKTEVALKSAGRLRAEGKDYIVEDGDIVHFLFNV